MDDPASTFFLFAAEAATTETTSTLVQTVLNIGLVILLVLLNGFFVCAEFAFVAVRKSRIEALAAEGSAGARRLLEVLGNMSAYLSAAQVGVTLASLGLGWVGEPAIASLLEQPLGGLNDTARHTVAFFIGFIFISSLHIVAGEQAPKLFGLAMAERVAMGTALPMQIFYKALKYPIHALDWASAKLVNLFGLEAKSDHASIYTEDEIRQLINVSEESGHLNKEERQLLHQVFEFSETTVREAMIPRTEIVGIPDGSSLEEIAEAFQQNGYSRLPVFRGSLDDIVGVIHSKDVMYCLLRPEGFSLDRVVQKPVYVVDTARLEDVLRQMQKEKFHFGFVVDEHGGVEGIITLEDLLEEIVGDISDEHDEEVNEQIIAQPDGSFILDGAVAVRDINRRLGLHLPVSEGYTTVAGFLMAEAGELLSVGESVSFNGHVFRVEKVDKRRILQVRMENSPAAQA
jgi:CBS domain containing-hemolysin-like protein